MITHIGTETAAGCGRAMCRDCFLSWYENSASCSFCRGPLRDSNARDDDELLRRDMDRLGLWRSPIIYDESNPDHGGFGFEARDFEPGQGHPFHERDFDRRQRDLDRLGLRPHSSAGLDERNPNHGATYTFDERDFARGEAHTVHEGDFGRRRRGSYGGYPDFEHWEAARGERNDRRQSLAPDASATPRQPSPPLMPAHTNNTDIVFNLRVEAAYEVMRAKDVHETFNKIYEQLGEAWIRDQGPSFLRIIQTGFDFFAEDRRTRIADALRAEDMQSTIEDEIRQRESGRPSRRHAEMVRVIEHNRKERKRCWKHEMRSVAESLTEGRVR